MDIFLVTCTVNNRTTIMLDLLVKLVGIHVSTFVFFSFGSAPGPGKSSMIHQQKMSPPSEDLPIFIFQLFLKSTRLILYIIYAILYIHL